MKGRFDIRREAIQRQGTVVEFRKAAYLIEGDQRRARFQVGEEGLVHCATELLTGTKYRIKCFWDPDETRLKRLRFLVMQNLADLKGESARVLSGAPFGILDSLGGSTRFASIMKNVDGQKWKDLRENATLFSEYPPTNWPPLRVRLLWAIELVRGIELMEELRFVHADLSNSNIIVTGTGRGAGALALIDFDTYFNEEYPITFRGTSGFAAPEIWNCGAVEVGSDRIAMAILVQDFLLVGDSRISAGAAFSAGYSQDEILALDAKAHPLMRDCYRELADLLEQTLNAPMPKQRPHPRLWLQALSRIVRTE